MLQELLEKVPNLFPLKIGSEYINSVQHFKKATLKN